MSDIASEASSSRRRSNKNWISAIVSGDALEDGNGEEEEDDEGATAQLFQWFLFFISLLQKSKNYELNITIPKLGVQIDKNLYIIK
jgi:hypothetical protein